MAVNGWLIFTPTPHFYFLNIEFPIVVIPDKVAVDSVGGIFNGI